jgi:DNA-binding CsgD family transcriptional regulator
MPERHRGTFTKHQRSLIPPKKINPISMANLRPDLGDKPTVLSVDELRKRPRRNLSTYQRVLVGMKPRPPQRPMREVAKDPVVFGVDGDCVVVRVPIRKIAKRLHDVIHAELERILNVRAMQSTIIGSLSSKERRALNLIAEGRSNKEIAIDFGSSLSAAKKHVTNLLRKTGCRDRTDLREYRC